MTKPLPVALLAHGAGSTPDFVRRAFGEPLAAAGYRLVTWQQRPGAVRAEFRTLAGQYRPAIVGGVSLGAHAAVRLAAEGGSAPLAALEGLLLALPAWTGRPGTVASASAVAAGQIQALGIRGVLDWLRAEHPGWVTSELAAAWSSYAEEELVAALHAVARSPGPSRRELASVGVPTGIVTLPADPLHPLPVARRWASAMPRAALRVVADGAVAADRRKLGRAVLAALHEARAQLAPVSAPR